MIDRERTGPDPAHPRVEYSLLCDLGNSRLKASLRLAGGDFERLGVFAQADPSVRVAALARVVEERLTSRAISAVALTSVASEAATLQVLQALGECFGRPPRLHPPHGLRVLVEHPETVGLDRLYAARGALQHGCLVALVVDVGTAMTVDAVRSVGGRGEFLGGAIAPGPTLLAKALAAGGARLMAVEPVPEAPALGLDTRRALEAGIAVGIAGAAGELVERLRIEVGWAHAPVVLTGGARDFVRRALASLPGRLIEDELLVERGLAAALDEEPRA